MTLRAVISASCGVFVLLAPAQARDRGGHAPRRRSAAGKKYRAHLVEVRSLFAITSPSVHSVQSPENINNLYPSLRLDGKASGQRLTEIGRI